MLFFLCLFVVFLFTDSLRWTNATKKWFHNIERWNNSFSIYLFFQNKFDTNLSTNHKLVACDIVVVCQRQITLVCCYSSSLRADFRIGWYFFLFFILLCVRRQSSQNRMCGQIWAYALPSRWLSRENFLISNVNGHVHSQRLNRVKKKMGLIELFSWCAIVGC